MVAVNDRHLLQYKKELSTELDAILSWWMNYMIDEKNEGFYGSVNNNNEPLTTAKGVVLNSRILWSFSATHLFTGNEAYLKIATRAFEYLVHYFLDKEYGGVFWSVRENGRVQDDKKQVYGIAFCIYGLTEYYKVSGNEEALKLAIDLFDCIEKYSFDKNKNGYIEAFAREWKEMGDMRLSEKDNNERKTMNTHLHIIEAYANLYSVWAQSFLKEKIINLLNLFNDFFINQNNYHLNLFFDDDWNPKSSLRSFGHDIEASWLLQQCAEVTEDKKYIDQFQQLAIPIADAAAEGLDRDGGLWYEYEPSNKSMIDEKHSWPQAESMVGFFNAWLLTRNDKYLHYSLSAWEFVKNHIRDNEKGEWFWGVAKDYRAMEKEKAGFWKCPYHTTRACIDLISRIDGTKK